MCFGMKDFTERLSVLKYLFPDESKDILKLFRFSENS